MQVCFQGKKNENVLSTNAEIYFMRNIFAQHMKWCHCLFKEISTKLQKQSENRQK